jgi:hypothetical protein
VTDKALGPLISIRQGLNNYVFQILCEILPLFVFLGVGVTLILNIHSDSREENMGNPVFIFAAYKVVINATLAYPTGGGSPFKIRLFIFFYIYGKDS